MRKILKWIGIGLGGLVVVALLALATLLLLGTRKWNARHELAVEPVAVPADPAAIERGRHLALVHCANCHGEDLGGAVFVEDSAFATIAASNLTAGDGGIASTYTETDWARAVRHGVNSRGRALFVMPAEVYYFLSDEDLGAIVAYLRQARVDRRFAEAKPGPVGRVLRALGELDSAFPYTHLDHDAPRPPAPPVGATAEYGEYMARSFGCRVCHGQDLAGGTAAGTRDVPSPNLTPGGPLRAWTEELFLANVRTRQSEHMPWRGLRAMSEEEQRAVWRYLASLPARASAVPATPAAPAD